MAGVMWDNWLTFVTDGMGVLGGKNSRMAHAFLVCTAQWWWWNKVDGDDTRAQTYQLLVKYYQVYGFLDAL